MTGFVCERRWHAERSLLAAESWEGPVRRNGRHGGPTGQPGSRLEIGRQAGGAVRETRPVRRKMTFDDPERAEWYALLAVSRRPYGLPPLSGVLA